MADDFCQVYDRFIKINGLAPKRDKSFLEQIFGKLVGDKGYICKDLFSKLFVDGIQLITKLKSNMKGQIMTIGDRLLLRKRALIETINDELKNMAQIEHSRHRSVVGFTVNLMAGLAAYSFFPKSYSRYFISQIHLASTV